MTHELHAAQVWPLLAGIGVAGALLGRNAIKRAVQVARGKPVIPAALNKRFYEGGFKPVMTRREAALILGIR